MAASADATGLTRWRSVALGLILASAWVPLLAQTRISLAQLGFRQLEHRIRRALPALLEEHKSAGQLNQTLEEIPVGSTAVQQPEIFEDVMGLMESLVVEAVEETEISGIQSPSCKPRYPCGDDGALVCHSLTLPHIRPAGG